MKSFARHSRQTTLLNFLSPKLSNYLPTKPFLQTHVRYLQPFLLSSLRGYNRWSDVCFLKCFPLKRLISTWNNSRRAAHRHILFPRLFWLLDGGQTLNVIFLILTRKSVTRKHHDSGQSGSSALPPAWIGTKWVRGGPSEAIVFNTCERNMRSEFGAGGGGGGRGGANREDQTVEEWKTGRFWLSVKCVERRWTCAF